MYAVVNPGSMTRRSECITARIVSACAGIANASADRMTGRSLQREAADMRSLLPISAAMISAGEGIASHGRRERQHKVASGASALPPGADFTGPSGYVGE